MKHIRKIRPATAFPFILGVFTGTLITTFLLLALRSIDEETPPVKISTADDPTPDKSNGVHIQTETEERQAINKEGRQQPHDGRLETDPLQSTVVPGLSSPRQLILYNVLSSKGSLRTRGAAIHQTWGSSAGARGHVQYYVFPPAGEEEVDFAIKRRIPITLLGSREWEVDLDVEKQNVFRLWRDICEQKLEQYQWFMKLQDDVYLRPQILEQLISSLNSSEAILLGRSVFPYGTERDELGLREGESYCFEGGYAVSWKALKMVCPYLSSCQENARSDNEDVEMARCIRIHARVNCTSSVEMRESFHIAEGLIAKEELQMGEHHLNPKVKKAMLLSPLTEPDHFYHLHQYYIKEHIDMFKNITVSLRAHMIQTAGRGAHSDPLLHHTNEHQYPSWTRLGVNAPYVVEPGEEVIHFQSLDDQYRYTESMHYPSHAVSSHTHEDIEELLKAILHSQGHADDTAAVHKEGRITVDTVLQRMDPQRGTDYFLHVVETDKDGHTETKFLHGLREAEPPRVLTLKSANYKSTKVNFVVPTPSVSRGFQRFMMSFENSFLSRKPPELVGLLVILYSDGQFKTYDKDLFSVTTLVDLYTKKYPEADLRVISMRTPYSRRATIELASKEFPSYELLFLADIHIDFSMQFLERCRMNAVEDKQVYFPAVFSPYNPAEFYKARVLFPYATKFQINAEKGTWMHESFHLACVYNYDLAKVLSEFDNDIEAEWNLLDQFIKYSELSIFRSVEPGLVHLWQDGCKEEDLGPREQRLCQHLESTL